MKEAYTKKAFAKKILLMLKKKYAKEMHTSLEFSSPWQLLVATILSAQTQDASVNNATKKLFAIYPRPQDYIHLKNKDLEKYIKSIGLYRSKAKYIIGAAKIIVDKFKGSVPSSMEELLKLPGVGRKTANVVLSNAFNINEGIAVDTHCIVVSNRLGLAKGDNATNVERELMQNIDKKDWKNITHLFIALGRDTCTAKKKHCDRCVLQNICPSSEIA
ncbi:MAG: endonuclease III [Candidatus Micrarchaeaceae archaeon]